MSVSEKEVERMTSNNLKRIDSLMNILEVGLRTYFPYCSKANYRVRLENRNWHGLYSVTVLTKEAARKVGYNPKALQKSFRMSGSARYADGGYHLCIPLDWQTVWGGVDSLFLVIQERKIYKVMVYSASMLCSHIDAGMRTVSLEGIKDCMEHHFEIDVEQKTVACDGRCLPFKTDFTPSWESYPFIFLPRLCKTIRAVVISSNDEIVSVAKFQGVKETASACGVSEAQVKNNMRSTPRNMVVKGRVDGELTYFAFLTEEKFGYYREHGEEAHQWYAERARLAMSGKRKTRSDVGTKRNRIGNPYLLVLYLEMVAEVITEGLRRAA